MRVVLSVGGSVLAPANGPERIAAYADVITDLVEAGCTVGVVVGGGSVARDYIESGRALGANEIELDGIGIAVTRLNARLLIAALGEHAPVTPAETYDEAKRTLRDSGVCIMGGASPGHTTDAVSAALAEHVGADLLVFATSVAGVYDTDPNVSDDATRFDRLTATELVELIADAEMHAGSAAPVDLLAAKLIERSGMHALVVEGSDPSTITPAVLSGTHDGTTVAPTGDATAPARWTE